MDEHAAEPTATGLEHDCALFGVASEYTEKHKLGAVHIRWTKGKVISPQVLRNSNCTTKGLLMRAYGTLNRAAICLHNTAEAQRALGATKKCPSAY